jgi:hypothetical protein
MDGFINKISSYNLFNYLFSGVLFVVLSAQFTSYSFIQENLIIGVFLYYFIGLVISRFGSLVVEPILRKSRFLKFADYSEFIFASKKDPKIEILSEENNVYRTMCSVLIGLILLKFYELISFKFYFIQSNNVYFLLIILLITFLFSYKKQTSYVVKRIKANLN